MATSKQEAQKLGGLERSPKWNKVRDAYLKKHPKCLICGTKNKIHIHHIYPFNFCVNISRPDLELDERNFMPLCEDELLQNHHLLIGHLGSFASYNPEVKKDWVTYKNKTDEEIQTDANWKAKKANRPKPFNKMTAADKKQFKTMLDEQLPLIKK